MKYHEPVLLNEVLDYLDIKNGKKYIDCTLGDGGHTVELLKKGAIVMGIDYDPISLETAHKRIEVLGLSNNFVGELGNFKDLENLATKNGFTDVDGILFDLGYSSSQLENDNRGFSFLKEAPLDMRIDQKLGVTAADLINSLAESQLEKMFREYGEERIARKFAQAIIERRELKKFQTTKDLAEFLAEVAPSGYDSGRTHPAMRVFQSLRITVNDELGNLKVSLPQAARLLKLPEGKIAVISFHSLEDRLVKQFGRSGAQLSKLISEERDVSGLLSQDGVSPVPLGILTKKPVLPSAEEVKQNRKARSAKMRVFERI